jgi:hypothetical protein
VADGSRTSRADQLDSYAASLARDLRRFLRRIDSASRVASVSSGMRSVLPNGESRYALLFAQHVLTKPSEQRAVWLVNVHVIGEKHIEGILAK